MSSRNRLAAWAAATAALAGSGEAGAQPRGDSEILVTGERLSRSPAQTRSSVVVLTREQIDQVPGAERLDQLLVHIPNVQTGSGGDGPTIRGQDTTGPLRDLPQFLGGSRPRATLQIDGRAASYNEFAFGAAPLWDVERVEVFRSPQTTTQGRNSIAGGIFIESAAPTFQWEARGRIAGGSREARQVSAAVSGPLLDEQIAFRISGDLRRGRSASRLVTTADVDPNHDDYALVRAKILAQPAGFAGLKLTATYVNTHSQAPQVQGIRPPYRARRDDTAGYGVFRNRVESLTVRAERALASGLSLRATGSLGATDVRRFAPAGFGEARTDGSDRSGELVLAWQRERGPTIVLGMHALEDDLEQRIDLSGAGLGRGAFEDRQSSTGIFGEIAWPLAPRIALTLGGRYQRDHQRRAGRLAGGARIVPLHYDRTFEALLPRFSLSYDAAAGVLVGVSLQRAYNPGGTTISLATFAPDTFEAEQLWAYEAFARASLAGGRITLSANAFVYDIADAQRSVLAVLATPGGVVTFAEIGNAPAAWSRGAELQGTWDATSRLTLEFAAGLLDTRITRTTDPDDPLRGREFQRSPHLSASARISWRPVPALALMGTVRHKSGYFSDDSNDPARRIGPSTVADARAEWRHGDVKLFGYLTNAFDSFHLTYLFGANMLATAVDPREVGFGAEARF